MPCTPGHDLCGSGGVAGVIQKVFYCCALPPATPQHILRQLGSSARQRDADTDAWRRAALRAEYANEVALALTLEAVVRARSTGDFTAPPLALGGSRLAAAGAQAWLVYCALARPWVRRLGAVAAGAASFLIVWSEATIGSGTHPDLSPFSHVRPPARASAGFARATRGWHLSQAWQRVGFSLQRHGFYSWWRLVVAAGSSLWRRACLRHGHVLQMAP